ncbi:MAG TPA: hypothetical protein VE684_09235, partial [Crenalkalicoccus sp.]|nr:hypothetical protein [Crenalkalicoccus sp.]
MSDRTDRLDCAELLRIALAVARFPRSVAPEERLTPADLDRLGHRFPGFLAARLDGFTALAAAPRGTDALGFAPALAGWTRLRWEGPGERPEGFAARLGIAV